MNRFVISEPKKCIGCRTCEVACVLAHSHGAGVGALTPINFTPRLKVVKGHKISMPVQCRHCEDAPCVNVCPNGAIGYVQGTVQVSQALCVGCKTCMMACPYGAMDVVTVPLAKGDGYGYGRGLKAEAQKCDLCIDRAQGPACIAVCPTKALHLIDQALMAETRLQRQQRAADAAGAAF